MIDEQDSALRKSLDAVDRGRKFAILGICALFAATILAIGAVGLTAARLQAPPPAFWGAINIMFVAVIAEMLLMACCTAIVMFHVTRMTRVVLRRIDLQGRE